MSGQAESYHGLVQGGKMQIDPKMSAIYTYHLHGNMTVVFAEAVVHACLAMWSLKRPWLQSADLSSHNLHTPRHRV